MEIPIYYAPKSSDAADAADIMSIIVRGRFGKRPCFSPFFAPFSLLDPSHSPRSRKKSVMVDLDINKVGSHPKKNFAFSFGQFSENAGNISFMFWSILLEMQTLFPVCFCQYCWDPR